MKRAFILFWKGLTVLLAGIAEWFTVILGMKDESRYGRCLRRIVGSSFALIMSLVAVMVLWDFCRTASRRLDLNTYETEYIPDYNNTVLSYNLNYHYDEYGQDGFVFDNDRKKVLKGIAWIAKPLGGDSLVCYSDGTKRGYFNRFTGQITIEPKYNHAWIFSEGIAAVDDSGWVKFIDGTGKVIVDTRTHYLPDVKGYVFRDGHCIMHNEEGTHWGIMDRSGEWEVPLKYQSVWRSEDFYVLDDGEYLSLLDKNLNTLIPSLAADYQIFDDAIFAIMRDHTVRKYSLQGELIDDFYISEINRMTYQTGKLAYPQTKEDGTESDTYRDSPFYVQDNALCMSYQAESGWYGLISPDGQVITPPSYTSIEAVGKDLYLCKESYEQGVLLNGKGRKVK